MGYIGSRLGAFAVLVLLPAVIVVGAALMFAFAIIGLAIVAGVLLLQPSVLEELR